MAILDKKPRFKFKPISELDKLYEKEASGELYLEEVDVESLDKNYLFRKFKQKICSFEWIFSLVMIVIVTALIIIGFKLIKDSSTDVEIKEIFACTSLSSEIIESAEKMSALAVEATDNWEKCEIEKSQLILKIESLK